MTESGGPAEHSRNKVQSIKHNNPEYFKRQSDRKMLDGGAGSGPQTGGGGESSSSTMTRSQQIIANREKQAKEKALQEVKDLEQSNKIAAEKHAANIASKRKYSRQAS